MQKMKLLGKVLTLSLAAGLLLSCVNTSLSPASYGTISLNIASLSKLLQEGGTAKSAERAIGMADSIKLDLYSGSSLVDSTTTTDSSVDWEVPVGTGYTLSVEVFNTAVSSDTPTVEGRSESFDVTADETTSVEVTCLPVNPTALTVGGAAQDFTLSASGEEWFSFSSDGCSYIDLSFTPTDTSSYIALRVFDSAGSLCYAEMVTGSETFTMSTSYVDEGYLVLAAEAANTLSVGLAGGTEPTDDEYEENDSWEAAAALAANTQYSLYGGDEDWYSVALAAGDRISATISVTEYYEGPEIQLRLYDASQNRLTKTMLNGTDDPSGTLEYTVPDAGTYYLRVINTSCNHQYDLEWSLSNG